MQAGTKGSEGLEGPCRRVTKPWQAQPITFSRRGKDLTHREAQPLRAELVKGREEAGGLAPGLVGNQHTPTPADLGQGPGWYWFR